MLIPAIPRVPPISAICAFPVSYFLSCLSGRFLWQVRSRFPCARLFERAGRLFSWRPPAFCIFILLTFVALQSHAQRPPAVVNDALKRAGIPVEAAGIYVQRAEQNGRVLVSAYADLPLNPASVMKLVTTDAALELLGPTFSWKTTAYAAGLQRGDVLDGDLIIKGGGDPKLVVENLWLFLRQVRARGIREIGGNLVLDRSVFAAEYYDPAQFDGDPRKPYNAGPDALLLNYKSLAIRFVPDTAAGRVHVTLDPPLADITIKAPALGDGKCGDWQTAVQEASDEKSVVFNGVFPAACGEQVWYLHPYHMTGNEYFGAAFRQMWRDLGGTFNGKVVSGTVPPGARQIAMWQSPTLPEVIRDINKFSNNVMARQTLLSIAAYVPGYAANPGGDNSATGAVGPADATGSGANTSAGARAITEWINGKGISAPDLVIDNGAGLSRVARISAGTLGHLLVAAFEAPTMPEFISSMPLVGYDGTMRRRLKDRDVAGQAHIKTGTLNNVRAIAGYVLAASGKYYAVVFLINHQNAIAGQAAQDALLQWVHEKG